MKANAVKKVIDQKVGKLNALEGEFNYRCEFIFNHLDMVEDIIRVFFGSDFEPKSGEDIAAAWPMGMMDVNFKPVLIKRNTLVKATKGMDLYDKDGKLVKNIPGTPAVYSYTATSEVKWTNKAFFNALFQYKYCGGKFTSVRAYEAAQDAAEKIIENLGL